MGVIWIGLALALSPSEADLIVSNARIWSPDRSGYASTLVVKDGLFVHVGDSAGRWTAPESKRIDAGGRVVVPGLIDSHIHMLNGGLGLSQIQLRDAKNKEEFVSRVRDWAAKLPAGRWLTGGRWSTESWAAREQPTKEWVDPVTGDRPMWLSRMDGHSGLANSAALKLAGITKDGPSDPPGGVIDRDPRTGEPTGILRETAMGLVTSKIPAATATEKREALKLAVEEAHKFGITGASAIEGVSELSFYKELVTANRSFRFGLYVTAGDQLLPEAQIASFQGVEDWAVIRGVKVYMDGSLGSRTAWMNRPFLGNPSDRKEWRGLPMPHVTDGTLRKNLETCIRNGWQLIAHAIGDEANHVLLNTIQQAAADPSVLRNRSEHAQHMLPGDIARFGRLGVICSMQPFHKADDGRYCDDYIGADRSRSSYAFRSLLNSGAVLAFGSDWPVVTQNPFLGMEAAVVGKTLAGEFWQTQENISVVDALRAYTLCGAYAMKMDGKLGCVSQGYFADFAILNRSPFGADVDWSLIRADSTFVGGRRVYGGLR